MNYYQIKNKENYMTLQVLVRVKDPKILVKNPNNLKLSMIKIRIFLMNLTISFFQNKNQVKNYRPQEDLIYMKNYKYRLKNLFWGAKRLLDMKDWLHALIVQDLNANKERKESNAIPVEVEAM